MSFFQTFSLWNKLWKSNFQLKKFWNLLRPLQEWAIFCWQIVFLKFLDFLCPKSLKVKEYLFTFFGVGVRKVSIETLQLIKVSL